MLSSFFPENFTHRKRGEGLIKKISMFSIKINTSAIKILGYKKYIFFILHLYFLRTEYLYSINEVDRYKDP
jgi:hypothetical protein